MVQPIVKVLILAPPRTSRPRRPLRAPFVDMNGDGCRRAGSGFIAPTNPDTDGPITVPGGAAGPLRPQSYDGTVGAVTGAVSEVFSGPNSPIRDIGFVAITPNMPAVVVPAVACTCTPVAGCPE